MAKTVTVEDFNDLEIPPEIKSNGPLNERELTKLIISPKIFDLPCSSPRCLEAMLYLRMSKVSFMKQESQYHYSAKGELPFLFKFTNDGDDNGHAESHGSGTYQEYLEKKLGQNLNENLQPSDRVLANSLTSHIHQTLHLVAQYMMWVDKRNVRKTFKAYGARLPLCIRELTLMQRQKEIKSKLNLYGITSREKAMSVLSAIFNDLETLLENKEYFFGDFCTSLDAVVGGELLFLFYNGVPFNYCGTMIIERCILKNYAYRLVQNFLSQEFTTHFGDNIPTVEQYLNSKKVYYKINSENDDHKNDDNVIKIEKKNTENGGDDEVKDPQNAGMDEKTKSWLFVGLSVATVVFYVGWYKGIRIEIQMD